MHDHSAASGPTPSHSYASLVRKFALHSGCLVIAIASLVAYEHFDAAGQTTPAWICLGAAAFFGFTPVRDLVRFAFAIEGKALHAVHALGGIALVGLPLAGVVSGTSVLSTAAKAPFAMMGAAQALMHSNHPRNAQQAEAMQRFVQSLPEIAQFTSTRDLTSPANVQRAVVVLTDIIDKAQTLGQTELDADPAFQSAWSQVSTRVGANLGLDAVDLALTKLAAYPGGAAAVAELRKRADAARATINDASAHARHPAHTG